MFAFRLGVKWVNLDKLLSKCFSALKDLIYEFFFEWKLSESAKFLFLNNFPSKLLLNESTGFISNVLFALICNYCNWDANT